jgi:hypothetical protein
LSWEASTESRRRESRSCTESSEGCTVRRKDCTAPEEARGEQNVFDKEKRRPDSQWKRIASEKERLYNKQMLQKNKKRKFCKHERLYIMSR